MNKKTILPIILFSGLSAAITFLFYSVWLDLNPTKLDVKIINNTVSNLKLSTLSIDYSEYRYKWIVTAESDGGTRLQVEQKNLSDAIADLTKKMKCIIPDKE